MQYQKTEIETTADGSATLYRADIDEHYHSVRGALTESRHVYIDCGLRHHASAATTPIQVLEVGLGTGLNAALSVGAIAQPVRYTAFELYPLNPETIEALGYTDFSPWIKPIALAPWDVDIDITPKFTLHKRHTDFLVTALEPNSFDVVYFDAFAPEKQCEMWAPGVFEKLYKAMRSGGVLTTYCAKGVVRRMLTAAGFTVERLAGPPEGKREILRAIRP